MELTAQFDPERFWQVHRSTIINLDHLAGTRRDEASRLFVRVRGHARERAAGEPGVRAPVQGDVRVGGNSTSAASRDPAHEAQTSQQQGPGAWLRYGRQCREVGACHAALVADGHDRAAATVPGEYVDVVAVEIVAAVEHQQQATDDRVVKFRWSDDKADRPRRRGSSGCRRHR